VFLLGPSHHIYLSGLALTAHKYYSTPLGPLAIDHVTTSTLAATGKFTTMSSTADEDEHSLEMHLPYIYKILSKHFSSSSSFPPLIPILVGSTSRATDLSFGALLAPYLADPSNVFVISSDFCHWGSRFQYTYYLPPPPAKAYNLGGSQKPLKEKAIYTSIGELDQQAIEAIETGSRDAFADNLKETQNTVCGRHPISVILATMEAMGEQNGKKWSWRFVKYARSSDVVTSRESSVSYVSAFAVLE
jgi:AmmeMemoRadiSam system protein B